MAKIKTKTTKPAKAKSTKIQKQLDYILLDRSGSMSSMWNEALSAVNTYVATLKKDKVDTKVTAALFDRHDTHLDFKVVRREVSPKDWEDITDKDGMPRSVTPLNDAVGKLVSMAEADGGDNVAIIIMTDGHENASTEYTVEQIKAKLDACRKKGWQVIFLGANFDNAQQAASYGTVAAQTVQSSVANLSNTMRFTASARAAYGATGQSMSYTADQKRQLKK